VGRGGIEPLPTRFALPAGLATAFPDRPAARVARRSGAAPRATTPSGARSPDAPRKRCTEAPPRERAGG
jgi:hypothetical protein